MQPISKIGKYLLEGPIGQGHTSQVKLGSDGEGEKSVAIKILNEKTDMIGKYV